MPLPRWAVVMVTGRLPGERWSITLAHALMAGGGLLMTMFVTRPVAEIFGTHTGYGFAGDGVNTATGNYTRSSVDLGFPVGLLVWGRTYNSLDPGDGPLGRGWTATLSAHLVAAERSVVLHDDDGRVLTFTAGGAGGYRRPQDLEADLVQLPDGGFAVRFRTGQT